MFEIKSQIEAIIRQVEMRQHHTLELGNEKTAKKLGQLAQTLRKALSQIDELLGVV